MQVVWESSEWRFDLSLWLYDDHTHVADWHRQLGERISPEQRRAVLRIKNVWYRRPGYPDEVSGLEIYRAVLDDGVRTPNAFASWLVEHRSRGAHRRVDRGVPVATEQYVTRRQNAYLQRRPTRTDRHDGTYVLGCW
jgi:hypothetical protein